MLQIEFLCVLFLYCHTVKKTFNIQLGRYIFSKKDIKNINQDLFYSKSKMKAQSPYFNQIMCENPLIMLSFYSYKVDKKNHF